MTNIIIELVSLPLWNVELEDMTKERSHFFFLYYVLYLHSRRGSSYRSYSWDMLGFSQGWQENEATEIKCSATEQKQAEAEGEPCAEGLAQPPRRGRRDAAPGKDGDNVESETDDHGSEDDQDGVHEYNSDNVAISDSNYSDDNSCYDDNNNSNNITLSIVIRMIINR